MTTAKYAALLCANGFRPFRYESSNDLLQARRNLDGRSHYFDVKTMASFNSRILACQILHDGLTLAIIESVRENPRPRMFRPLFFDILGHSSLNPNDLFCNSVAAQTRLQSILACHDAVEHTRRTIKMHRDQMVRDITNCDAVL